VEAFADAFAAHSDGALAEEDLRSRLVVDAVVPGRTLNLELCGELRRLGPFGLGNPRITLLLAGCELVELGAVGEGKHLRFRVRDTGRDAGSAIAFGLGTQLDRYRRVGHYDVAFRLEENRWNGTVAPQLVVRRIFESPERYHELRARLLDEWRLEPGTRSPEAAAIFAELGLDEGARWRSLLESEAFRALLAEEPLLAAAA